PQGNFPATLSASARAEEIVREFEAQFERARRYGIRPAYLEYGGADHPDVAAALHALSERLGVPARMTAWGIQPLTFAEKSPRAIQETLGALEPGVYLWLTHPAHDSPESWALWNDPEAAATRHAESLALCSAE